MFKKLPPGHNDRSPKYKGRSLKKRDRALVRGLKQNGWNGDAKEIKRLSVKLERADSSGYEE